MQNDQQRASIDAKLGPLMRAFHQFYQHSDEGPGDNLSEDSFDSRIGQTSALSIKKAWT